MKLSRAVRSVNWRVLAVTAALGVAIVPNTQQASVHAMSLRGMPSLLQQAASNPHASFNVIVTKRGQTTAPEALVRRAGGKVTQELPLIHSFAARMPGSVVGTLASNRSVNWLSVNGPVHRTSYTCCTASTLQQTYDQSINAA